MVMKHNNNKELSKRVVEDLLDKGEICSDDLVVDEKHLTTEYSLAEAIDYRDLSIESPDFVVALSGRSGFSGHYLENANKFTLCPDKFDPEDTIRRVVYSIEIAKKYTMENLRQGIKKPVYVYFNGVKKQNDELREILKKEGSYKGYPACFFIIDPIPLDNTLGQVVGLSSFLTRHWQLFCQTYNLARAPRIVLCSSSYHVPRVTLGFAENSPILTPEFWKMNPGLFCQLTAPMQHHVLSNEKLIKKAEISVLGCDRHISANPHWQKDLYNDMQARLNYSSLHRKKTMNVQPLASIAARPGKNITTFFRAYPATLLRKTLTSSLLKKEQSDEQEALAASNVRGAFISN